MPSDLPTDNFLAAFKICRKGRPLNVYCDNGATSKGANDQLYKKKEKIENFSSKEGINFKFIPIYSPVFGGLWEARVKNAKFYIKRVEGNTEVSYIQFNTLIIKLREF